LAQLATDVVEATECFVRLIESLLDVVVKVGNLGLEVDDLGLKVVHAGPELLDVPVGIARAGDGGPEPGARHRRHGMIVVVDRPWVGPRAG
jgi:hypothetical protein